MVRLWMLGRVLRVMRVADREVVMVRRRRVAVVGRRHEHHVLSVGRCASKERCGVLVHVWIHGRIGRNGHKGVFAGGWQRVVSSRPDEEGRDSGQDALVPPIVADYLCSARTCYIRSLKALPAPDNIVFRLREKYGPMISMRDQQ